MDLRIKKTQRTLSQALDSLLDEKNYEDITVSEICSRAEVRRATFYDHFSDKYDLLSFVIKRIIAEYSSRIVKPIPDNLDEDKRRQFYTTVIVQTIEVVKENIVKIRHAMGSGSYQLLTEAWHDEVVDDIEQHLLSDFNAGMELSLSIPLLAEIYFGLLSGIVNWMIGQTAPVDEKTIAQYAENLVQHSGLLFAGSST